MPCSGMKSSVLDGATIGCVLMHFMFRRSRVRTIAIRCVVRAIMRALMDDIDRQIVALLRQDARRSFQSIGAARLAVARPRSNGASTGSRPTA